MTIAAGFVCSDGLVFASDTLYTELKKKYGQKFWIIDKGDVVVVFGGAGTAPGLKRVRDILAQTVKRGMSRDEAVRAVESALSYVEDLMKPTAEERTYALIGIRVGAKYWLYENGGGKSALTVIDGRSHCVGSGYPLGLYFADTLFTSNMPMKWAKVVAAHLIKHVKIHNSVFCGGRTHIVELPASGKPHILKDKGEITLLEQYFADVDEAMRIVLPDGSVSDHTLDERLKRLTDVIRNLRLAQFIAVPSQRIVVGDFLSAAIQAGDIRVSGVTPTGPQTSQDLEAPQDRADPKDES